MSGNEKKFDIAISFLHKDEPLALQLNSNLSESLEIFVYSKKQEELAGTDGLESFRQVFRYNSRLVVVLYRDGWGKTSWTRVEEAAIKDRFLDEGWDWLLFVMLDNSSTPPVWLPKSQIRLNLGEYGIDQLLGAIKMRAQKLGSVAKVETALDRAKRLEQDSAMRAERTRLISEQGATAFRQESQRLWQVLTKMIESLNEVVTTKIRHGFTNDEFVLRATNVSVNLYLVGYQLAEERHILLTEWLGGLIPPQDRGRLSPSRQPKTISKSEYYFDWQSAFGWCWHIGRYSNRFITTDEFAEQAIKNLLDLQERFERKEIRWGNNDW